MDSDFVKQKTVQLGADICNIAPVSRFKDAPKGFHPNDPEDQYDGWKWYLNVQKAGW